MVLPNLPRILLLYFLFYIEFVYSARYTKKSPTLPSYEELYPDSLVFSIKGDVAYNFDESMKIFRYEDNWIPIYYGTGGQNSVNVMLKEGCTTYDCVRDGNIYTYYPKDHRLFNMVRSELIGVANEVIWALTGATDYANKVVYNETNSMNKIVTIHHINGKVRTFVKKVYREWEEIKPKISTTSLSPNKVEIKILSENGMPGVVIENNDDYLKYTFEPGVRCMSIEYDRTQILRTRDKFPNSHPKFVMFCIKFNTVVVSFDHSINILRFYNNLWIPVYSGSGEGKSVNVLYKDSCENYGCITEGNVYTYKAKDGKLFNKVRSQKSNSDREEVIFETTDILEMAIVVKYNERDPSKFVVHIHQLDGMVRTFTKSISVGWTEYSFPASGSKLRAFRVCVNPLANTSIKTSELHLNLSKIEVLAEDPCDPSKSIECDLSMYDIETTEGIMITYRFKDGVKCVAITYDNKVAWRHNPSKTKEYPKYLHFLLTGPIVVEMSKDLFYFSFRKNNGNFESVEMGKLNFKATDIELLTMDSRLDPALLKPERYDLIEHPFFLEYRFPSGTRCEALKLNTHYPWMFDRSVYGQYPSAVYLFPNEVLVMCGDKAFVKRFDPNNLEQFYTPREIMKPALAGFKFAKKNGYLFYEIDPKLKCVGVEYDGMEVWQRDPTEVYDPYPKSVMFCIKSNTAIVGFGCSGDIIRFEEGRWKSIIRGHPRPVRLDIKGKHTTCFFEYEKIGKVHTYTAEGLYVFSALIKTGMFSNDLIWKTVNLVDCANKVIYDETDSKNKVLIIHHVNGLIRKFKNTFFGSWEEVSVEDSGSELTADKVEIHIETQPADPEPEDVAKQSTLETSVAEGHSSETEQPGPSLGLNPKGSGSYSEKLDAKKISQYESKLGGSDKIVSENEVSVAPAPSNTASCGRSRVDLDLGTRMSTEQFDYSQSNGLLTYTANDDYYFRSVKNGETEVWRGGSIDGSAMKVIAEVDLYSYLVGLTLHLLNGQIKRFKISDGKVEEKVCRTTTGHHSGSETLSDVLSPDYEPQPQDGNPSLRAQECVS